jgi:hypothetical protein
MIRYSRWNHGVLVLTLIVLAGCSSAEGPPKNGVVRGRVTFNGQPLAGVTIEFLHPETMFSLTAKTEPDGGYEVKTYKEGGLAPGRYQIAVRPRYEFDSRDEQVAAFLGSVPTADNKGKAAPPKKPGEDIPEKYRVPIKSGLEINVVSGDNPPFDFNLTGKP